MVFLLCAQGFRPQGAPGYPGMQMQRPGGVSGASSYPGAMAGPGPGPGPMHMSGLPGPPGGAGSMPQQLRPPMHPVSGGSAGAAPNVWTEHKAPDGRTYYHNKALGKSSWEKPAELLSSKVPCSTLDLLLPHSRNNNNGTVRTTRNFDGFQQCVTDVDEHLPYRSRRMPQHQSGRSSLLQTAGSTTTTR